MIAMPFPKNGTSREKVVENLSRLKEKDWKHREGRLPLHGYFASDEVSAVADEAFSLFAGTNALAPVAFPSCAEMERNVITMTSSLLGGGVEASGNVTSGGTESIILSVKAARDKYFSLGNLSRGNIVIPSSAHPAFDKAAQLLCLESRRIPVASDWRCDVKGMNDAIDENTILIAGSAPSLPYGLIDHIGELSEVALLRNVWLHVDACVGGFLAPFVKRVGYHVPDFDFGLRGVRSISADLHKFGYSSKGASVVIYRNGDDHRFQFSQFENWPKGEYFTPTLAGTRSGGPMASAWAVMNFLGEEGYCDLALRLMSLRDRYISGFKKISHIFLIGEPELSIVTVASSSLDIFSVADSMRNRGWYMSLVAEPQGIQQTINLVHEPIVEKYFDDFQQSVFASLDGISIERLPASNRKIVTY